MEPLNVALLVAASVVIVLGLLANLIKRTARPCPSRSSRSRPACWSGRRHWVG